MREVFIAFGDRLLGRLLRNTSAGACVPEVGTWCRCFYSHSECVRNCGRKYWYYNYYLDCWGRCVRDTSSICERTRVDSDLSCCS